jgi:hypothetical protein
MHSLFDSSGTALARGDLIHEATNARRDPLQVWTGVALTPCEQSAQSLSYDAVLHLEQRCGLAWQNSMYTSAVCMWLP